MTILRFLPIFCLLAIAVSGLPAQAQPEQNLSNDEYVEEYREEVRANRPSLTYAVFEPAINFFKMIYDFIDIIVTFIYDKVTTLLDTVSS